jgi:arylsulfatase A-like enzyme
LPQRDDRTGCRAGKIRGAFGKRRPVIGALQGRAENPRRNRTRRALWAAIALLIVSRAAADDTLATCDSPPVILIVIDTLRADHLGTYGYARLTSPALDAFARTGAVFSHAYATSPWTLPSFGSIFTGLLPSQHGAGALLSVGPKVLYGKLADGPTTLAERFHAFGYPTQAVAGNPNLDPRFGVARGFDGYDYYAGGMDDIRRADVIVDRALAWIGSRHGAPFFLFIHFFDPHMNYDPPAATRGRFTNGLPHGRLSLPFAESARVRAGRLWLSAQEQEFVRAAYDEEIAFVDLQLGRLFAALQADGLFERSIVLLTADHGEEHWDHNGFEHGHTLYEELVHVPLIVWGPGVRPGRIDDPISLIDVPPTLLAAVGAPAIDAAPGLSLWPLLTTGEITPARPLLAERPRYGPDRSAVIRWPYKAVIDLTGGPSRLFDLSADPGERVNLSAKYPGMMASLRSEATRQAATRPRRAAPHVVTLDNGTRERLRALGYLE